MKKLIIATILSLFILPIQAQNLISDSAVWHYSKSDGTAPQSAEFYRYSVEKDTLFKGQLSKKIKREAFRYAGDSVLLNPLYIFDRNDTVFYYNDDYQRYLPLYDFTALLGDTLQFYIPDSAFINNTDSTFKIVVDSVKMLPYGNTTLKAVYTTPLGNWTLSGLSSTYPYIEKIGSTDLMLPDWTNRLLEHDGPLRCYEDDSIFVSFYGKACDYRLISSLDSYKIENSAFQIHPNPVNQTASIELGKLKAEKIELIDISGRLIKTFTKNTKKLDFSAVKNGIYIVRVSTANQGQFNKKIVVQK